MLNPTVNGKFQGLFKAFEFFPVLFKANLIFKDFFKTVLYIQVLFKPVRTLIRDLNSLKLKYIIINIVNFHLCMQLLFHFNLLRHIGRVLYSRLKGSGFEPHQRHCLVSLSKNINPS